jgi:murein tripeptide amidase MpaA
VAKDHNLVVVRLPLTSLVLAVGIALIALGAAPVDASVSAYVPTGYSYFHTYAQNEALIDSLVKNHPTIAKKFSIGPSYEGRQIWGIELTNNVNGSLGSKPEVYINGLIHARERAANELALYLMQVLANNYGLGGTLGQRVTGILNTTVVWIVPMVNPDGAEYDFSSTVPLHWRKNRQSIPNSSYIGIDLNRQPGIAVAG